ncbi:MAG: hypothetical protein WCD54_14945, partial [Pseudolabrys sp.]
NHRHDAAGLEGFPHIAQPRYGVLEKLRAKSRKTEIVNGFEWICLYVLVQESDVGYPRRLRVLAAKFQKCITTIDRQNRSGGAYQPGQLDRSIAKATARIDHFIAGLDWQSRKDCLTVQRQPINEDMLPADEFRDQYAIPEVDVLAVLTLVLSNSFNGHNTPPNNTRASILHLKNWTWEMRPWVEKF